MPVSKFVWSDKAPVTYGVPFAYLPRLESGDSPTVTYVARGAGCAEATLRYATRPKGHRSASAATVCVLVSSSDSVTP